MVRAEAIWQRTIMQCSTKFIYGEMAKSSEEVVLFIGKRFSDL
jgi:hypothetical protein